MTCDGIAVFISPANSMKRVDEIVLAGPPGEIEGIDRDAVAAQTGPGVERREAERLGGRGLITSQTSISIRSNSTLSSLTSAMLTLR